MGAMGGRVVPEEMVGFLGTTRESRCGGDGGVLGTTGGRVVPEGWLGAMGAMGAESAPGRAGVPALSAVPGRAAT
jgi:hypothetical protein